VRHTAAAAAALLGLWAAGAAAQAPEAAAPPPPPPADEGAGDEAAPLDTEALEGQIVIRPRKGERIEEYRVNGRLYMVKVIPRKGPPYYLIDSDGDGHLDTRRDELDDDIVVPHWVIIRW